MEADKNPSEKVPKKKDLPFVRSRKNESEFYFLASKDLVQGSLVFLDCEAPLVQRAKHNQKHDKQWNSEVPWQVLSRKFPYSYSCRPNCRVDSFHPTFCTMKLTCADLDKKRGVVVVRTILPVKKGEILTVGEHFGTRIFNQFHDLGTPFRREIMREMDFICNCDRCADPTEAASFTSAVTCSKCFDEVTKLDKTKTMNQNSEDFGYFLPLRPLDFESDSPWKCTKCEEVKTWAEIDDRVMSIFQKFMNIFPSVARSRHRMVQDGILAGLFEDCGGRNGVHPNHWILVKATSLIASHQNAELDPIQNIPIDERNLPIDLTKEEEQKLELAIKRAEFCLRVIEKTCPGWTKTRGSTLWILWFGKFLLANRIRTEKMTQNELVLALKGTKNALELLKEAIEIRRFEFNPLKSEQSAGFNAEATTELTKTLSRIKTLEKLIQEKENQN